MKDVPEGAPEVLLSVSLGREPQPCLLLALFSPSLPTKQDP